MAPINMNMTMTGKRRTNQAMLVAFDLHIRFKTQVQKSIYAALITKMSAVLVTLHE